ncbi:cytochrome P450 4c21-like [Centruroides sculpturatus]|uniref:cytochrome P450 4c21-like n=1 Tax=Centruroides sculpturatus TaxID=218467 RepID=UPI000C6D3A78|nr:cytochrome P450 4c21-like [Centruroides sculpturatus]
MCLLTSFQILLSLLIISLLVIYLLGKKWRNRRKQQVNYPSSSASEVITQLLSCACLIFIEEKLMKISWGGYNYIVLSHPEVAQEVLKNNTVINKDWIYNILHPWLGTGLFTSSNDKWRHRRKLLTPAFHFRILEDFQRIFNNHSNILVEKLKNKKQTEEFLIDELIRLCNLDIIGGILASSRNKCFVTLTIDYLIQEVLKNNTVINKDWIYNILHPWLGTVF